MPNVRVPIRVLAVLILGSSAVVSVPHARASGASIVPAIVEHGRKPLVRACADCHLTSGLGRPDSSSLAGLPADYLAHQMADFRRGLRRSSDPRTDAMTAVAGAVEERDVVEASEYFASLTPRPWITVVERPIGAKPAGEPIVEVPAKPAPGFVASVPGGALERGEFLVEAGGAGRTVRCANCHGGDLRGTGAIPGIAGRSPSYMARQLNDMRRGVRHGVGADRMMGTVARITEDDVVAIAAYAASLAP